MRAQQQRPRRHPVHCLQHYKRNRDQHCARAPQSLRSALHSARGLPHHSVRTHPVLRHHWPWRANARAKCRIRWRGPKHREGRHGSADREGGADDPRDEEEGRTEGQRGQQRGPGDLRHPRQDVRFSMNDEMLRDWNADFVHAGSLRGGQTARSS
jgi:hypothetical protein